MNTFYWVLIPYYRATPCLYSTYKAFQLTVANSNPKKRIINETENEMDKSFDPEEVVVEAFQMRDIMQGISTIQNTLSQLYGAFG